LTAYGGDHERKGNPKILITASTLDLVTGTKGSGESIVSEM